MLYHSVDMDDPSLDKLFFEILLRSLVVEMISMILVGRHHLLFWKQLNWGLFEVSRELEMTRGINLLVLSMMPMLCSSVLLLHSISSRLRSVEISPMLMILEDQEVVKKA